ncbi:MAG: hypothetical protein QOF09_2191 [Alphaproteobacteria bacterium]|jgi:hypothetical protein|nr:hypothetical protein [Alphaproteobacteria bacterium]
MPAHLAALALSATLIAATGSSVPDFDARPSCQAGAQSGVDFQPNVSSCVQDEQQAKSDLVKEWGQFSGSDKDSCVAEAESGGPRSYIELLTCLQVARDAAGMHVD